MIFNFSGSQCFCNHEDSKQEIFTIAFIVWIDIKKRYPEQMSRYETLFIFIDLCF